MLQAILHPVSVQGNAEHGPIRLVPQTAPSNPGAGSIYYDSATNRLFYYNGSQGVALGHIPWMDDSDTLLHFNLDEPTGSVSSSVGGYTMAKGVLGTASGAAGVIGLARGIGSAEMAGSVGGLFNGVNAWTMSVWLNMTALPATNYITWAVSLLSSTPPVYAISAGFQITVDHLGRLNVWVNGGNRIVNAPTALVAGTWYHLAVTLSAANDMRLYKNGVQVATGAYDGGFSSVNRYSLIGNQNESDNLVRFNGALDDLVWLKRELTAPEVATVYDNGV